MQVATFFKHLPCKFTGVDSDVSKLLREEVASEMRDCKREILVVRIFNAVALRDLVVSLSL